MAKPEKTVPASEKNRPIQDLREWLERVQGIGDLVRVTQPVSIDEEMSAIGYLVAKQNPSPAILFDNPKGYENSPIKARLLWNILGPSLRRIALTMEEAPDTPAVELIRRVKDKLKNRMPPREVSQSDAGFYQNSMTGDKIDLTQLPIPRHWPLDGGRYAGPLYFAAMKLFAEQMGVPVDHVMIYDGSSPPLHYMSLAFTSPTRSFVCGNPTYEAGQRAAEIAGAKIHAVPLAKDYSHDTEAMVKADPNAGLIYICNPNNPTGTITSKEQIDYAVANKPAGTVVLLDEAYIHLSKSAEPGTYLVAADKDVIILRTFSKLFGMAGLRAGAALGRDLEGELAARDAPADGVRAAQQRPRPADELEQHHLP